MDGLALAIKIIAERLATAPPQLRRYLEEILVELEQAFDRMLDEAYREEQLRMRDYNLGEAEVDF